MNFIYDRKIVYKAAARVAFAFVAALSFTLAAFAQSEPVAVNHQQETGATPVFKPLVTELKGITLGMTADEVEDKLGDPEVDEATSLYYIFDNGESLQIALDADKKVKMIARIFLGSNAQTPEYSDVFGPTIPLTPAADGRIYNLVRYPDAGYWVAYGRIQVDNKPMTTVTIQKIG